MNTLKEVLHNETISSDLFYLILRLHWMQTGTHEHTIVPMQYKCCHKDNKCKQQSRAFRVKGSPTPG